MANRQSRSRTRLTFAFSGQDAALVDYQDYTEACMRMFNPPHPGEVLREYLGPVSVTDAAKHLGVTRAALSRILNGSAGISAEMALRLADALGTTPELWIGMQSEYDLWKAARKSRRKIPRLVAVS